jgi:membrane associated rhomboid family serine protease
MIPIRDDTPRFSTPFVTYFIIALNTVVFVFELSVGGQGHRALNSLIYQFGGLAGFVAACIISSASDLDVPAWLVATPHWEHVVSLDLR